MPAPKFPGWLPTAVAHFARRLLKVSGKPELVLRLATDRRMKGAWKELLQTNFEWPLDESDASTPATLLEGNLSNNEAALVTIFWVAYRTAREEVALISSAELRHTAEACTSTARQLREGAAFLRMLPSKISGSAVLEAIDFSQEEAGFHANALEEAARFCETAAAQQKGLEGPQIISRHTGKKNKAARAYVRLLASHLSEPLYGTIAAIASVALDRPDHDPVTKDQVVEWTSPARGGDKAPN
jgi:hypothetical protein